MGERRLIFGEVPEQYHRHRPRYPAEVVDVGRREVAWPLSRTRDDYLAVLETYSGHRLLEAATQRALLKAIGNAIDAAGGSIDLDGRTVLVTARRC